MNRLAGFEVRVVPDADERFAGQPPDVILLLTLPGAATPSAVLVRESEWGRVRAAIDATIAGAS